MNRKYCFYLFYNFVNFNGHSSKVDSAIEVIKSNINIKNIENKYEHKYNKLNLKVKQIKTK